jgi:hypothetical protein
MKFIRCKTIAVVNYIKPHLVLPWVATQLSELEKDEIREKVAEDIKLAIEHRGDDQLFILVCIANEEVLGFIIGYVAAGDVPNVFIPQVWVKTFEKQHLVAKGLFERLVQWTENLGIDFIMTESSRSPEALARAWKFEPVSTVMSYQISKHEPKIDEAIDQSQSQTKDGD